MWQILFLFSKVSSAAFNILLVNHMNPYFILLILMIDQISSDLHGVIIKFKTKQPRTVHNAIKMQIMLEFSTEDGQFQVLFILCLVLLSSGKYRFNQVYPLTKLVEIFYACTSILRKKSLSGDTWNP